MRSRSPEPMAPKVPAEQPKQPEQLPSYMRTVMIFARVRFKAIRETQPDVWKELEDKRRGLESHDTKFAPDLVCGASIADSALTAEDRDYIAHLEFATVEEAMQGLVDLGFRKENLRIEKDDHFNTGGFVIFKDGRVLTSRFSQLEFEREPDRSIKLNLGKIFLDAAATEHLASGNI